MQEGDKVRIITRRPQDLMSGRMGYGEVGTVRRVNEIDQTVHIVPVRGGALEIRHVDEVEVVQE